MRELPHHYTTTATAQAEGDVLVEGWGLRSLHTAPPPEFGGPGNRWSPETLLAAAVADCFVFMFRAHARAVRLQWETLSCEADGVLDRVDGKLQFTRFIIRAVLRIPEGSDTEQAHRTLERAERTCLIANSLMAEFNLESTIEIGLAAKRDAAHAESDAG